MTCLSYTRQLSVVVINHVGDRHDGRILNFKTCNQYFYIKNALFLAYIYLFYVYMCVWHSDNSRTDIL